MPRQCTVCALAIADRAGVDGALLTGTSYRDIARQWRVSKDAVARHHAGGHVAAAMAKAQDAAAVARGDDLLAQVRDLQGKALGILAKAEAAGDLRAALAAIREARGNLELLAKLLGELQDGATVNVLVHPEWVNLRANIVAAVAPYPAARAALLEAIGASD
ncbi:MAG: hypothetical protein ACYC5O_00555 [Anaerolineae bacterium]